MAFYEELKIQLVRRQGSAFQGIVFNDLRWKLKEGTSYCPITIRPRSSRANRRIDALLEQMDEDTIILHPSVNEYHNPLLALAQAELPSDGNSR